MTISSMKCYDVVSHNQITDCSELWEEESAGLLWVWYNYVMLEYLQHQQHDNFWLWMWTVARADRIWTSQSFFLPSSMPFNFISSCSSAHLAAFSGLDWQICHSNVKSFRFFCSSCKHFLTICCFPSPFQVSYPTHSTSPLLLISCQCHKPNGGWQYTAVVLSSIQHLTEKLISTHTHLYALAHTKEDGQVRH